MIIIDTTLAIVLVLSIVGALVLGVVIVVAVEGSRLAGRRMRALRAEGVASTSVDATGAERLRVALRHEVALTQEAVAHAAARGLPVGELRDVLAELSRHAERLDDQLGIAVRQAQLLPGARLPDQLRDHHRELAAVCERIRADLLTSELKQSSAELDATLRRATIEVEALQAATDALADPLQARIAEIDEAYRQRQIEGSEPPER